MEYYDNEFTIQDASLNYKTLVLSGGGHKGLLQFGSLYFLQKNTEILNNISSYYGTSVGSLNAFMISLPIPIDYLYDYIVKRPWYKELGLNVDNIFDIFDFSKHKEGILDHTFFDKILNPLLDFCELSTDITFIEYKNKFNKQLNIFSTELDNIDVFCCNSVNTPDMKIVDAIKMSCSIPYLFEPYSYDNKKYFDGFVHAHYPMYYAQYDLLTYIQNVLEEDDIDGKIDYIKNNCILGLSFDYNYDIFEDLSNKNPTIEDKEDTEDEIIPYNKNETNIIEFFKKFNSKILKKICFYENKQKEININNYFSGKINKEILMQNTKTISLPVKGLMKYAFQTLFDEQIRNDLVSMGYEYTKKILELV